MNIRKLIETTFYEVCEKRKATPPENLTDDLVLLKSGLDSLGFAILVTSLELKLGYDPFTLLSEPVYPKTFGEFVALYEKFSDHAVQA